MTTQDQALNQAAASFEAPYQRPADLKERLSGLFKNESDQIIMLGKNKENNVTIQACGRMSTSDAAVMLACALAQIYSELPMEEQRVNPLNTFLNSVGAITASRLSIISPSSPIYFNEVATVDNTTGLGDVDLDKLLEEAELDTTGMIDDSNNTNQPEEYPDEAVAQAEAEEVAEIKPTRKRVTRTTTKEVPATRKRSTKQAN